LLRVDLEARHVRPEGGGGGGRVEVMGRREEEGEEEELLHQPDDVEVADAPAPELLDLALDGVEGLLLALGPGQGALEAPRLEVRSNIQNCRNLGISLTHP